MKNNVLFSARCAGVVPLSEKSRILYSNNPQENELVQVKMGQHYRFYDQLVEDIAHPKEIDFEVTYALAVVGIMEMAKKSMDSHQEIEIPFRLK